jgi:hypothetical protein
MARLGPKGAPPVCMTLFSVQGSLEPTLWSLTVHCCSFVAPQEPSKYSRYTTIGGCSSLSQTSAVELSFLAPGVYLLMPTCFRPFDGNCVYHMDGFGLSGRMYVRDLNDGTEEVISGAQVPDDGDAYGERRYGHSQATCSHARPQSLPQLLLAHCRVLPRSKCCY